MKYYSYIIYITYVFPSDMSGFISIAVNGIKLQLILVITVATLLMKGK